MQIELQATKVYIGNISNGFVSAEFSRCLLDLAVTDKNNDWGFWRGVLWGRSGVNITEKRNEVIRQFLKTDGEWLLLIDSDMVFPEDIIPRMLHAAKQAGTRVLGGLCVVVDERTGPYPTLFHLDPEGDRFLSAQLDYPSNAILQVDATGAACLLVHREVLQAVRNSQLENRKWLYEHKDDPLMKQLEAKGLINVASEDHGWFSEHPVVMHMKQPDGSVVAKERWVGEDIDFCLRIGSLGYQVFVDCGLEIGHHKEDRIWYPRDIKEGIGFRRPPITVVIPVKDRLDLTSDLVNQIRKDKFDEIIICDNGSGEETKTWLDEQDDITVIDCPNVGIHVMWNRATEYALDKHGQKAHIAFLNNDLKLSDRFIDKLSTALFRNSEMIAVSGNYDDRTYHSDVQEVHDTCANRYNGTGGLAGFAFMVRGEWFASGYKFPEECMWWFGENDLMTSIEIGNVVTKDIPRRAGIVINAAVEHLNGGGGSVPGESKDYLERWYEAFGEQLEKDRIAYEKIYAQQMQRLQAAQNTNAAQIHTCHVDALEIIKPYMDRISADRLPFIADLEDSVKSFTRQWSDDVPSMVKIHEDVERYEKIIAETQPEVVVECGTFDGGSAEWLANLGLDVVTIDIEDHVPADRKARVGENVNWLIGSSVDVDIVAKVKEFIGNRRCMVALDSDHHTCHVLAEMELYKDLVSNECYMVVEDGLVRWVPIDEHRSLINHGPMQALECFLAYHHEFERDEDIERLHPATMHPAGWLRRI
jgi:cephalosporin hydroxylase/GT2 family glycosyltransferase